MFKANPSTRIPDLFKVHGIVLLDGEPELNSFYAKIYDDIIQLIFQINIKTKFILMPRLTKFIVNKCKLILIVSLFKQLYCI